MATILGLVGLIVSATGVLMQLQQCLNKAWKVKVVDSGLRHFAMQRLRSGLPAAGRRHAGDRCGSRKFRDFGADQMLPFPDAAHAGEMLTSLAMFAILFAAISR